MNDTTGGPSVSEGYIRVRLVTVQAHLVTDLAIPPFARLPEVILWGARSFMRESEDPVYREVFAYAAPYEDEA